MNFVNRLIVLVWLGVFLTVFFGSAAAAKADVLIIKDDGQVILVITSGTEVLGVSSATTPAPQPTSAPQPEQKKEQKPEQKEVKTVPVTAPHVESTVSISLPVKNDKKLNVTITPVSSAGPAAVPQTAKTNGVTKVVDEVVAQGANRQKIYSIKSNQANQLTIEQANTQVSTKLPLQIDTKTHDLSVSTPNVTPILVLPKQAVQGVVNKGLINSQNMPQVKISLTQSPNGVGYNFQGQKTGKLLNLFDVSTPVEVQLSAQNGKIEKVTQSPVFSIFGSLINPR